MTANSAISTATISRPRPIYRLRLGGAWFVGLVGVLAERRYGLCAARRQAGQGRFVGKAGQLRERRRPARAPLYRIVFLTVCHEMILPLSERAVNTYVIPAGQLRAGALKRDACAFRTAWIQLVLE